jgi:F0F1-type ATP synthase membrane subunit c/vacuolar-type H+-ATPase subunit K
MLLTEMDLSGQGVCRKMLAQKLSSKWFFALLLISTLAYFALVTAQVIIFD